MFFGGDEGQTKKTSNSSWENTLLNRLSPSPPMGFKLGELAFETSDTKMCHLLFWNFAKMTPKMFKSILLSQSWDTGVQSSWQTDKFTNLSHSICVDVGVFVSVVSIGIFLGYSALFYPLDFVYFDHLLGAYKKTAFVYSSKLVDMQKLVDSLRGYLEIVFFGWFFNKCSSNDSLVSFLSND